MARQGEMTSALESTQTNKQTEQNFLGRSRRSSHSLVGRILENSIRDKVKLNFPFLTVIFVP